MNQLIPVSAPPTPPAIIAAGAAQITTGRALVNSSGPAGRWAAERLLAARRAGRPLNASVLRTQATLRKDEWIEFDEALVREGTIQLVGIADLVSEGLVRDVPNGLGKTVFEYEDVSDMNPAIMSLDGLARSDDDTLDFLLKSIPLPMLHKDWNLGIRRLAASSEVGETLDTTQAEIAGRLVSELLESVLFIGGNVFGGGTIFGYTTHTDRNTVAFSNGHWNDGVATGEDMIADVISLIELNVAARFRGPYWLYIPGNFSTVLGDDYKANSDKTIMERIEEIPQIGPGGVRIADQCPADNIVLVARNRSTTMLVSGEPLQAIEWDLYGGMAVAFKAMQIAVPLIRADQTGRSGVSHMS